MTAPAVLLAAALSICAFALGMLWGAEIYRPVQGEARSEPPPPAPAPARPKRPHEPARWNIN